MRDRTLIFVVFLTVSIILYIMPLRDLFRFAWGNETFSYIPLVPFVSVYFIYEKRKEVFSAGNWWHLAGVGPIAFAVLFYSLWASQGDRLPQSDSLTLIALSFLSLLVGGLGLFYGIEAWKAAAFPLFFLLFMVPIPSILLDKIVNFLQVRSADVVCLFLGLTGVPIYRDGFYIQLPGISIEVAKECSGIRSSISLFLVSLIAGHLMLGQKWRKAVLSLSIVPITIVKNAVRIVTLSLLAVYVDPGILGSVAHQRGGIPIFFLALLLLGSVLWLLRRGEKKRGDQ